MVNSCGRKPDVLLVDDEPSITAFQRYLLSNDFDVREVHGVRQALRVIDLRIPDIVVTDLDIDEGGGRHLLAAVADSFPTVLRVVYSGALGTQLLRLVESGLAHGAVSKIGDSRGLLGELTRLREAAAAVLPKVSLQSEIR